MKPGSGRHPIPSAVGKGKFVDFADLTRAQQDQALKARPKLDALNAGRLRFWVKPNGEVSRRKGHHELTKAAFAEVEAELGSLREQRALERDDRGDVRRHRTARFHVNKEPL